MISSFSYRALFLHAQYCYAYSLDNLQLHTCITERTTMIHCSLLSFTSVLTSVLFRNRLFQFLIGMLNVCYSFWEMLFNCYRSLYVSRSTWDEKCFFKQYSIMTHSQLLKYRFYWRWMNVLYVWNYLYIFSAHMLLWLPNWIVITRIV